MCSSDVLSRTIQRFKSLEYRLDLCGWKEITAKTEQMVILGSMVLVSTPQLDIDLFLFHSLFPLKNVTASSSSAFPARSLGFTIFG